MSGGAGRRAGPSRVGVVVVAEHALAREGLAAMLGRQPGFSVLGTWETPKEAAEGMAQLCPDLVVVDLDDASFSADTAWTLLHDSHASPDPPRVVFVLPRAGGEAAWEALRLPAAGYLAPGDLRPEVIGEALVAALQGRGALGVGEVRRVLLGIEGDGRCPLTARELQVLRLVVSGRHDREIAEQLSLSLSAVCKHVRQAVVKLGARTRAEAVAKAIRRGYL